MPASFRRSTCSSSSLKPMFPRAPNLRDSRRTAPFDRCSQSCRPG
jgi:hypothetical protein